MKKFTQIYAIFNEASVAAATPLTSTQNASLFFEFASQTSPPAAQFKAIDESCRLLTFPLMGKGDRRAVDEVSLMLELF